MVLLTFVLIDQSFGQDDLERRLSNLEAAFKHREQDLEARVTKLEELIKIGTLRSCSEYSQFGIRSNDYYLIDPDGPLLGQPPFQVFCDFSSGVIGMQDFTFY